MASRWRDMESYLSAHPGQSFNAVALAADLGVSSWEATQMIQAYLGVQRLPNSRTLYVLYRKGRTRAAVWHVGVRSTDMRLLSRQYLDDAKTRVIRALEPDLARMGVLNPRASQFAESIGNVVEANLQLLAAQL